MRAIVALQHAIGPCKLHFISALQARPQSMLYILRLNCIALNSISTCMCIFEFSNAACMSATPILHIISCSLTH